MAITCPVCAHSRRAGQYLCPPCWRQLPADTRTALHLRDADTLTRLRALLDAINAGTPLAAITIA